MLSEKRRELEFSMIVNAFIVVTDGVYLLTGKQSGYIDITVITMALMSLVCIC